jgi:hypothetical protein
VRRVAWTPLVALAVAALALAGCALFVSFSGLDDGGAAEVVMDAADAGDGGEGESAPPLESGLVGESSMADAAPPYLGCYMDGQTRDLPYEAYASVYNTIQVCVEACTYHGYLYAGLQDGIQCYCGNSYGGQGPAGNCTTACPGNPAETCGGPYANSVYRTSVSSGE